ncbi:MAG: glycoside hydrolase N-terminal domain-containing protein, partial [Muribaculum sp.]|nr:glycoside hydrolase N-terminal domain-containing protein [Muribaculum sp.]
SVLVIRLSADKPGAINVTVGTNLLREATHNATDKSLNFEGKVDYPMFGPGGVEFFSTTRILPKGGNVKAGDKSVKVENADEVVLITDIRTNMFTDDYKNLANSTVANAVDKGYDALKSAHIADVAPLFNRMSISFGNDDNSGVPTDVRLHLIKNGAIDPDFDALFFQYGRYMQIASSRPGSPLCSNLQGVWNDDLACHMGWTCDYHLDININQNYWSANKANLAECNEGLFTYVKLLEKYGSETASKLYGCNGWCAHTVTNPWGFTAPGGDIGWGLAVSAGAWLATELWSHYLYTLDTDYLRETGYPLLKSCAEFYMDYMIEDPNTGYLVTGPSVSPENAFCLPDGRAFNASMMPTLDLSVVKQIYTACIESSKILNVDKKMRQRLEKDMAKLPPFQLDNRGQLKEWLHESYRQDPSHRHSSHIHCMYPFGQISYTRSPELMEGARKSIEAQTADPNWENTEWSCGNMLCFYSFLKDGEMAHNYLQNLFHTFTRENLMTVSPKGIAGAPEDIFSFDATEASVAGMCDMLLQSFDGFIEFLPALPSAWADGHVKGLCAQGDIQADLNWKDSKLTDATLKAGHAGKYKVKLPDYGNPQLTLNG